MILGVEAAAKEKESLRSRKGKSAKHDRTSKFDLWHSCEHAHRQARSWGKELLEQQSVGSETEKVNGANVVYRTSFVFAWNFLNTL